MTWSVIRKATDSIMKEGDKQWKTSRTYLKP